LREPIKNDCDFENGIVESATKLTIRCTVFVLGTKTCPKRPKDPNAKSIGIEIGDGKNDPKTCTMKTETNKMRKQLQMGSIGESRLAHLYLTKVALSSTFWTRKTVDSRSL
jgi:hypothetical protein